MPTTVYTAPAAAGKTAHCVALARETAAGLRAEVRVCVPTALQAVAWRQRLAAGGGALGVHVLSYDGLVAACLNAAQETYTEIDPLVQFHLLRRIINQQPLRHYNALRDKPGFVQVARQLIEELKSARIDPPAFRDAVRQIGAGPRLLELADTYDAYQTQLQEQRWADRVGLSWLAVDALTQRDPAACRDWPLLIVDGFDDFTPIQLALLAALAGRVGDQVVTLPQATQIDFPRHARTRAAVEAALGVTAKPLPPQTPAACHRVLDHLGRTIFGQAPTTSDKPPAEGVVVRQEVPDYAAEVRAALRWLKQQIVGRGLQPSDVALLARDLTPYRPFIGPIAAEFGLPVRLDGGLPLLQSPVVAALLELLRVHLPVGGVAGLPRREVVALWRSPYFDWTDGDLTIIPADADLLDTVARQFRVIRGAAQWQAAFDAAEVAWAAQRARFDEDEETLTAAAPDPARAAALRARFDHFLAITQPPTGATSLAGYVRWLERLIGPDDAAPPGDGLTEQSLRVVAQARAPDAVDTSADIAALRALKDVLRGLVWAEAAVGQLTPIDFPAFYAELAGAITTARYTQPWHTHEETVLIAPVVMARGLGFEAVAVLGLGEGSFPATVGEDPFLRDDDRANLREAAGFTLLPSTVSAEREFFYEAVTRPRRALLLTRSILADNGADWVASPFWEAVGALVEGEPVRIPAEQALPPEQAASWVELWESAAREPGAAAWAGERQPAAWARIRDAASIWRDRAQRRPTVRDGHIDGVAADLGRTYGPDQIWSASRLESYQTCGFLFYTGTVLGLEPRPDPAEGLDARQLGHLYHEIFEEVYRRGLPDPEGGDLAAFVAGVAAPILDSAPEKEGFRETPWWSQTQREIIGNVTRSITMLESAADGYRFLQSEAAFGFSGNPALIIGEGDDRLLLRGFIDRVDRHSDGHIRIIDYKLPGMDAYKPDAFRDGKKLQLPLYALAAEQALGLGEVRDGFYWHIKQAKPSGFTLATATDEAVETAVAYSRAAVAAIRAGAFTPRPPADGCPSYCAAAAFCYHYAPKRW